MYSGALLKVLKVNHAISGKIGIIVKEKVVAPKVEA